MTEDRHTDLTREEFVRRFTVELIRIVGPVCHDEDGDERDTAEYAADAAPTYFEEDDHRAEGPEECARVDYSYWE